MAKMGEGDARWIVEDRQDGRNVNGWHWQEVDAMHWCKARLQELFAGMQLVDDGAKSMRITGLDSVTGEAVVNNRKNKLIPSYELDIKFSWEGRVGEQQAKGKVTLPYVSDENADEEPQLTVGVAEDTPASAALKEALLRGPGKQALVAAIHKFVAELRAGGPQLAAKGGAPAGAGAEPNGAAAKPKPKLSSAVPEDVRTGGGAASSSKASSSGTAGGPRTELRITEKFYCRAHDLFECFVVEGKLMAFTQSKATVEARPGGKFSWFGGAVQGEFEALEPNKKLVFKWQFTSWGEGCMSKVVMDIDEPEPGNTVVTLLHTGIPATDKLGNEDVLQNVERGWKGNVFSRIRQVFGYGMGL